ncbi:hypothetical protein HDU96_001562, partial [Phlyctochytrium bullatum]
MHTLHVRALQRDVEKCVATAPAAAPGILNASWTNSFTRDNISRPPLPPDVLAVADPVERLAVLARLCAARDGPGRAGSAADRGGLSDPSWALVEACAKSWNIPVNPTVLLSLLGLILDRFVAGMMPPHNPDPELDAVILSPCGIECLAQAFGPVLAGLGNGPASAAGGRDLATLHDLLARLTLALAHYVRLALQLPPTHFHLPRFALAVSLHASAITSRRVVAPPPRRRWRNRSRPGVAAVEPEGSDHAVEEAVRAWVAETETRGGGIAEVVRRMAGEMARLRVLVPEPFVMMAMAPLPNSGVTVVETAGVTVDVVGVAAGVFARRLAERMGEEVEAMDLDDVVGPRGVWREAEGVLAAAREAGYEVEVDVEAWCARALVAWAEACTEDGQEEELVVVEEEGGNCAVRVGGGWMWRIIEAVRKDVERVGGASEDALMHSPVPERQNHHEPLRGTSVDKVFALFEPGLDLLRRLGVPGDSDVVANVYGAFMKAIYKSLDLYAALSLESVSSSASQAITPLDCIRLNNVVAALDRFELLVESLGIEDDDDMPDPGEGDGEDDVAGFELEVVEVRGMEAGVREDGWVVDVAVAGEVIGTTEPSAKESGMEWRMTYDLQLPARAPSADFPLTFHLRNTTHTDRSPRPGGAPPPPAAPPAPRARARGAKPKGDGEAEGDLFGGELVFEFAKTGF